jgi:hypothetical protein
MAYKLTLNNITEAFGATNVTMVLHDDAGVYPDIRVEKSFAGKHKADITVPFMAPYLKAEGARLIQDTVIKTANVQLDALCATYWAQDVLPALATFEGHVRGLLASKQISEATLVAYIISQCGAYSCASALAPPVIKMEFIYPQVGDFVRVSN